MKVEIYLEKSVDENAGRYFDLAKKNKKKLEGAKKALEESKTKLALLLSQEEKFQEQEAKRQEKKNRKKEWYEKFHWFFTSEGFLCVGGKDATSNEIVVKKHTEKEDLVFHTDMAGSPFFVIKEGQRAGDLSKEEAAQATAAYSRAWKLGHATADVFYVKPEQVTKEAQSGEHLAKGSFMVYGKNTYLHPSVSYAIGLVSEEKEGTQSQQIIGGPPSAVQAKTENYLTVIPGREKKSALAKKIRSQLKGGDLDDIISFLPAGGAEIKKEHRRKK